MSASVEVVSYPASVSVVDSAVSVSVVSQVVTVEAGSSGPQGVAGPTGATGATGAAGSSGVVSVVSPITNSGSSSAAVLGFDQTAQNTTNDSRYARLGSANAFTVGGHTITNAVASVVPLMIKGVSGQSANYFELRGPGGSLGFYVDQYLGLNIPSAGAQIRGSYGGYSVFANPTSATVVPILAKGAVGQTANLFEGQSSAGSVLAKTDSAGNIFGNQLRTLNTYVTISEANSGGSIRLLKGSAAAAPLSNEVRIQVLAGTNANTLKLVAVGPNGVATTILDNLA